MDSRFEKWAVLWGKRTDAAFRSRHWDRVQAVLPCTKAEAKDFAEWFLAQSPRTVPEPEPDPGSSQESSFEHRDAYWYDAKREVYVLFLPHLNKPLALPARIWADIKSSYSQWDGSPATVEQVARKCGLTRRTVTAILRSFSHTHTGSPWTREVVATSDEDNLVEDLLLAKEERVLRRAEEASWDLVKKKAESFDRLQKGTLDTLTEWLGEPHPNTVRPALKTLTGVKHRNMVVIGLSDLHMGAPNHDAVTVALAALEDMLTRVAPPALWVLPLGGDNIHFDTVGFTTTNGTRLETAGPARHVVSNYMDLYAEILTRLSEVAPVLALPVAGNHDRMMSYAVFAAMRVAFTKNPNVTFAVTMEDVQVVTHGETLVALHHGDKHKPEDMSGILPRDFSKEWGVTKRRYCLMGHYHSQGTFGTKSGLECIYMPSLAPSDEWHLDHGWKNDPAMSAYEFAPDGLVAIHISRRK